MIFGNRQILYHSENAKNMGNFSVAAEFELSNIEQGEESIQNGSFGGKNGADFDLVANRSLRRFS
jgi:hypothetical protein